MSRINHRQSTFLDDVDRWDFLKTLVAGSLSQTNQWAALTSTNGSGSLSTVTATDPSPDPANRFYRLARQPSP